MSKLTDENGSLRRKVSPPREVLFWTTNTEHKSGPFVLQVQEKDEQISQLAGTEDKCSGVDIGGVSDLVSPPKQPLYPFRCRARASRRIVHGREQQHVHEKHKLHLIT